MSKPKKNSVKSQGGDPFTRWLVIGMVAFYVNIAVARRKFECIAKQIVQNMCKFFGIGHNPARIGQVNIGRIIDL